MKGQPSQSDLLGENEGTHDRYDYHAERIEGGDEDRSSLFHHDSLHVVGHPGAHYSLQY